jgi:hypothetical protein
VTDAIATQLERLEPPFSRLEDAGTTDHEVCFRCEFGEERFGFVLLLFSPKGQDTFTVELAYSPSREFPYHRMPDLPIAMPMKQIERGKEIDGEFRFRIGFLLPGRKDTWREVSGPAAVPSAVTTLVDVIRQDGILILKHGIGGDPTGQKVL